MWQRYYQGADLGANPGEPSGPSPPPPPTKKKREKENKGKGKRRES